MYGPLTSDLKQHILNYTEGKSRKFKIVD